MARSTIISLITLVMLMLALGLSGIGHVETAIAFTPPTDFETWEVWVDDCPNGLGAWQVEIRDTAGTATLVGIEGGEHPAYRQPATYDPAALQGGLVVLAAFSTREELPTQSTRVASLHVMTNGQPDWKATLEVAIDREGADTPATLRLVRKP